MPIPRSPVRISVLLVTGIAAWATVDHVYTQGPPKFVLIRGSELAAAVNLPDKNLKLEASLFVPASATAVRAVIVFLKHGETEERILTGLNPYSPWHAVAEALGCGLLHLRVSPIRAPNPGQPPPETVAQRNAAAGGGEGLIALMDRFSSEFQRPELRQVPFVFWGWSEAAGFGPSFARLHPQRTLAFIRYHSHLRGLPVDVNTAKEIPALLFVGGQDSPELAQDALTLLSQGRTAGARWAMVVQPEVSALT